MITNSIQFTTVVKELNLNNKEVRRGIEDALEDFTFSYEQPIQLPPEIPQFSPLMIGQTKFGHSRLQISNRIFQLVTTFDKEYDNNREKCFDYSYQKIESIVDAVNKQKLEMIYCGLIVQYVFENLDDVISLLNRNSVKLMGDYPFFNFAKKFSVVYGDRYYVNFELASLIPRDEGKNFIGITIDINNRYGVEINKSPHKNCDIDAIKRLLHFTSEEVLKNLLSKGELNLNDEFSYQ